MRQYLGLLLTALSILILLPYTQAAQFTIVAVGLYLVGALLIIWPTRPSRQQPAQRVEPKPTAITPEEIKRRQERPPQIE
ncbi:hypothetical protein [Thermoproteus tenax]|uniref:Uncharacterized conserved protein, putative transporter n=1 Tax=Thermoproteus tenax (strain ATCC 35583 / DSM 2078 / JCM 9277 / NBRC 100435 / Kra 1) TaxID=768679 RepID=G4RP29_THETK|nr:hypothetical protein [Thermoproteus tenax]CCC81323.1 Uncharacterized conserved protein, putative transporter [Thermoproteus tenax Kra 1]